MSLVIQLGNSIPQEFINGVPVPLNGPAVTEIRIDPNVIDGKLHPAYVVGTSAEEIREHMDLNPGPVKHLGGNELVQEVFGHWPLHAMRTPTFVSVIDPGPYDPDDMEDFERLLAEYWDCPRGTPEDLEDVYFTEHSNRVFAPGEAPSEV